MRIALFSYGYMPSGRLEPYRERLAQVLAGAGIEVLVVKTNSFFEEFSHLPKSQEAADLVARAIAEFAPDLAISINRTGFTQHIRAVLGPATPRITWFQDPYYYATKELQQCDQNDILYFIFPNPQVFESTIRLHAMECGAKEQNIYNVPYCLDDYTFFRTDEEKDIDICFVGSSFSQDYSILLMTYANDKSVRDCLIDVLLEHRERYIEDIPLALQSRGIYLDRIEPVATYLSFHEAIMKGSLSLQGLFDDQLNMERRIHHLSSLADFNFLMFGLRDDVWIPQMCIANPKLLKAYQFEPIESAAELAQLYRRAKIGFNISRVAAAGVGFSFRVPEVLATGALLMIETAAIPALQNLGFVRDKHYVAYEDPDDLRRLCAHYLQADTERNAIVQAASDHLRALAPTTTISALLSASLNDAGFPVTADRIRKLQRGEVPESLMDQIVFLGNFEGRFSGRKVLDVSRLQSYAAIDFAPFFRNADESVVSTGIRSIGALAPELLYDLNAFCSHCRKLAVSGDIESALGLIIDLVVQIVARDSATASVFSSLELDALCQTIGGLTGIEASPGPHADQSVYIVTTVGISGGHSRVLRDLIAADRASQKTILATGTLLGLPDDLSGLENMLGARIELAPDQGHTGKLIWLQRRLRDLNATTIYILQHHFDAVCTAAAQSGFSAKTVFFHNADHNLSLGVHLPHAIHADFNEKSFFNCRDREGVTGSVIVPLTANAPARKPPRQPNVSSLKTCCCGGFEKFELPHKLETIPYSISYADVVATRLSAAPGEHLHIGPLSSEMKGRIADAVEKVGIPLDRFVQIDHVDSLSDALTERGIDIYMGSAPRGGGRATVEAMAAGAPLLLHSNYRTQFLSDENEVYPEALIWRNLHELRCRLSEVTEEQLSAHGELSRVFFDNHFNFAKLRRTLDEILAGRQTMPNRRTHRRPSDPLQAWLDEYYAGPIVPLADPTKATEPLARPAPELPAPHESANKISAVEWTPLTQTPTMILMKTVIRRVLFRLVHG